MHRTILATAMVSSVLSAILTALTLGWAVPPASRAEPALQDLTASTLRVQQIVLIDTNGTPRGTWAVSEDGAPTLYHGPLKRVVRRPPCPMHRSRS